MEILHVITLMFSRNLKVAEHIRILLVSKQKLFIIKFSLQGQNHSTIFMQELKITYTYSWVILLALH
jgi:hypothetical protein